MAIYCPNTSIFYLLLYNLLPNQKHRIYTSKKPKHGHIQSYSVQRFLADCRCIRFVTNQCMQLQQLNTDPILILYFAIDYLHFVF